MTAVSDLVYDPYAYAIHEDPYPTYARLRAEAPLYRNDERNFWALSRHSDVIAAFRDATRFSSAEGVTLDPSATGRHAYKTMSFLAMDEPDHGRLRGLVSRGFTPRRVLELEPRVRAIAVEHIEPAVERGHFDLVTEIAGRIPMDVVSELLGVPRADRDELRRLADLTVHRDEGVHDVTPEAAESALTLVSYYAGMIAERRKQRTDDLTSALIDAEVDGDRLTNEEIISVLFLMVVAGNETTTKLITNAWYWAWRFPDERKKPFAEPGRIPEWVEETLRFDTSTQMLARTAATDIELYDNVIGETDRVLLLVGSANRDEGVFPNADSFDIGRDTTAIASFGSGRHFCLGASLARLETKVALEELVGRVQSYDIDEASARRVHSVNVRGFAALPTEVRVR